MTPFHFRVGAPVAFMLLLSGAATAQQSAARFKPLRPLATAPQRIEGVQRRIDGRVADQLRRTAGPLAAPAAKLPFLPMPGAGAAPHVAIRTERAPETGLPIFIEAQPLAGAQRPARPSRRWKPASSSWSGSKT